MTLTVDTDTMRTESATFDHAWQAANPTYQTVFYQWYKNGEPINGATSASYTVKSTDKNSRIHCVVTLVDGKCGIGEQYIIGNAVTVFNVDMPLPKSGETRIYLDKVTVDGAEVTQIYWENTQTEATLNSSDTYEEGIVYELIIMLGAKDGFTLASLEQRTVYIYGVQALSEGGYAYSTEVTAIHVHQYSDLVWAHDGEYHWQPCITPGCPCPEEEYEGYVGHWGGGATCHSAGTCEQCGESYFAEHDFSVPHYVYKDEMTCVRVCGFEGCDATADWNYHTGGIAALGFLLFRPIRGLFCFITRKSPAKKLKITRRG